MDNAYFTCIGLTKQRRYLDGAAGAGAEIAVLNHDEERRSAEMAEKVKFVELANDPEFQDVYVDQMFFGDDDE